MPRKLQDGGLYSGAMPRINPRPQGVEDIPVFNAPTYDLMTLPQRDILALADRMQLKKATKEASDLAEQKYQDTLAAAYMDYKTKLLGPVHTTAQKQRLESLMQRKGVSLEGIQGLMQNQVLLKGEIRKLQDVLSDTDYINTAGEVFRGNKFREYAAEKLSKDEFVEWEETAWEPYTRGEADLEEANPVRFKSAKALKNVNFRTAESTLMGSFDTTDLNNPEEVRDMAERLAMSYYETNPEAAVAQGLLKVNDDGTYQLTPTALQKFITAVKVEQRDKVREAGLKVDYYQTQRAIADAYADGNRVGRSGSSTGSDRFPNLTSAAAIQIANVEYADILKQAPELDPNDPDLILEVEKLATLSVADRPAAKTKVIKALKEKARLNAAKSPLDSAGLPGINAPEIGQAFTPTTPQSVAPAQTKPKVYNPVTRKFE